jgi:phosphate transport system permease protein
MTDILPRSMAGESIHTSKDARSRLKARYGAEARFRALGLGALLLAGVFLAFFLYSIVREGVPAFFQHYVALEIDLPREDIDPTTSNDPRVIQQANFDGFVARSMRAKFPEMTDRAQQRTLASIISSGSAVILRTDVLANREWIGTRQRYFVPSDDLVDLYLKGTLTRTANIATRGEVGASAQRGTVQLSSTVNNFEPILAEVKLDLARRASGLRSRVAGQERSLARTVTDREVLDRQLRDASGQARTVIEGRIRESDNALAAARAEIQRLTEQAADFERRATAAGRTERLDNTLPSYLVRMNGGVIKLTSVSNATAEGTVMLPLRSGDTARAGDWSIRRIDTPEANRRLNDTQITLVDSLVERGFVEQRVSRQFFTGGASREPELAGVWSAIVGSFMTLIVTLALAFPVGVGAALYLEQFAPKNRFTEMVEVNINNLAAVPSIIFGLLGLAIFLNVFDMPRSAPVVGGVVLALMTLPIIIIASRAAIRAVPPSIKEAALGIGASHQQAVFHHVLPLAMPGILTGTILGMAHALGETAPLLMIGMVAFVVDVPSSLTDPATLLPVQIFMWADFPEVAFQQKTAAAIMILLLFLISMNAIAVFLRKKFERRW